MWPRSVLTCVLPFFWYCRGLAPDCRPVQGTRPCLRRLPAPPFPSPHRRDGHVSLPRKETKREEHGRALPLHGSASAPRGFPASLLLRGAVAAISAYRLLARASSLKPSGIFRPPAWSPRGRGAISSGVKPVTCVLVFFRSARQSADFLRRLDAIQSVASLEASAMTFFSSAVSLSIVFLLISSDTGV